jgi:hypothetical protein
VRLVNGNLSALSLFYSLRVVALGDDQQRVSGHSWFMGVNFANDPDPTRPGRLMGFLHAVVWQGADVLDSFVAEVTIEKLLESRARVMADTMADLGATELLADSYLRWEIAGVDHIAEVAINRAGGWTYRARSRAGSDEDDAESGGVTLHFSDPRSFLYAAGGREQLTEQLVGGRARLLGDDHRLQAFSAATRRMYSPGGAG